MPDIKQISDDLSVASQVTPEQLQQVATKGFRSVLNLRSPQEEGFLTNEPQQVASLGLEYTNIPVNPSEINDALATEILQKIDELPKPTLIHCASGLRAGAMAFMHLATSENLNPEQVFAKAGELGFDCSSNPQLKQFLTNYILQHSSSS
ncbi:beta-lactamase hydrolase domain-containing protein [Merismopedia glauca]|uniref:Phosphatase n=1 Tax=Merismopedia glauca CCAP 1448/3 TaxID=1296344 RepID=A0A2T1BWV1_9CYAN|nr:protein tyrosine phosphatase family protein [Merismopedia glauca]PSB00495.1 phosphatase [Merismopedia glauca CCAP 1448/3]